jgi:hypothetical protein
MTPLNSLVRLDRSFQAANVVRVATVFALLSMGMQSAIAAPEWRATGQGAQLLYRRTMAYRSMAMRFFSMH